MLPSIESDEFLFLARRLGYWEEDDAAAQLAADIEMHRERVARVFAEVFEVSGRGGDGS